MKAFSDSFLSTGNPRKQTLIILLLLIYLLFPAYSRTDPLQDQTRFRQHYQQRFPQLSLIDYADGIYAIDQDSYNSWQAIEEFPPYELAIEQGEKLFHTAFKNGNHYADCFANKGLGIAHQFPLWDKQRGEVVTLALAINACRTANHEAPLAYQHGELAQILAYMAYTSRGKAINIKIPDDPDALAAYQQGKDYYYQRRGQLNFACSSCHVQNAGKRIRSEILSPALGHTSNWPTYRLKWGEIGTLHRRFKGCHKQIRAASPDVQSPAFRHLEYFLAFMANGIPINGPSIRK